MLALPRQAVVREKRDHILSSLRVGKQSPEYKRTKAAIDSFISEMRSQ